LALAVLEKSERQTVLRQLADDIAGMFSLQTGLTSLGYMFDVTLRDHRRDLIEVIRYLIRMNVLSRIDGDEQQYLASHHQDVLYTVNLPALMALPNFRRGPSTINADDTQSRLAAILDEPYPDTDEGRNRRLRTQLFRKLLDDPIVYYADLAEDERSYLIPQRPSITKEIEETTGLVQEARQEGVAMVDPEDEMIDLGMPEEGTDGHLTLLVAEYLAKRLRAGERGAVGISEIELHVESLIRLHQHYWRKSVGEPGAAHQLTIEALGRLEKLHLINLDSRAHTLIPCPAIGRYAIGALRVEPPLDDELWENEN
jgi:uncharacterized protein (TIGR02678 family)